MTSLFLSHFHSLFNTLLRSLGQVSHAIYITGKMLQVKCLFSSDPENIKSVYAECKQRNFQENIRRRYVMQTDNYTVQITFWEPKPVNSQASAHLLKVV